MALPEAMMKSSNIVSLLAHVHAKLLQLCLTLCDAMDCPARLLCPWDSLGNNTGVSSHALLQGIFLTQGWNLCLLRLLP